MYSYSAFVKAVRQSIPRFGQQWLNPQQDQAVAAPPNPPTFIVAGPGTGKTTVLVLRILKLILVDGIPPSGIIATTFTRKAAKELRSRVLSWGHSILNCLGSLNLDINQIRIDTLDSLCEQFLAESRQPGQIIPATIESFVARSLMRQHGLFPNQRFCNKRLENVLLGLEMISKFKNSFGDKLRGVMTIADRVRHDAINLTTYATKSAGHQVLCDAINDYLNYLQQKHLADFGRLESLVLQSLLQNGLSQVVSQLKALLIDEFQDTNYLQEQVYLELCRQSNASLTVVGDDDQSIFRFRSATVEIFSNFPNRVVQTFGQAWTPAIVYLSENYRSTQRIVEFCQHFIDIEPTYQQARVSGKPKLIPRAPHACHATQNIPILGMFRTDVGTLAEDLAAFLWNVFRQGGQQVVCRGVTYTIAGASGGDLGDSVLLAHSVRERSSNRDRLPLLLRQKLQGRGVRTFNPRGRDLGDILEVQQLLGLALNCIDPGGTVLANITSMAGGNRTILTTWMQAGQQLIANNPPPGGLGAFVQDWQARRVGARSVMPSWPKEWPLLELIFTLMTWFPSLQCDPEGQVYLEAITRTIAEAGQMSSYRARLVFTNQQHQANSVREAIRTIFEPIAQGAIEIDEEIMPFVPRNYFPIMTVHQAKGLEFPLVIVDVGSDFSRNHPSQRRSRAPQKGDAVHNVEDDVSTHCPIGPLRTSRPALDRAWDDLRRLYFVAYSRPENVLLLVGLTNVICTQKPIPCIAAGALRAGRQGLKFVPANQWSPTSQPGTVALI